MGFFDTLLGRTKPVQPNLDQLFGLPSAAIGLEAATHFRATGTGSVCFKSAEGGGFAGLQEEVEKLLLSGGGKYDRQTDSYGFTWLICRAAPDALDELVTDLHGVNSTLTEAGFGPALLCTLIAFTDGARPLGLIYLYKRGTWYPFAPTGASSRDSSLELQIKAAIADDLKIEQDLARWFPVYGAPGL
jgi:hypothetical protein